MREFAEKIDVLNTEQILNYGSNAQKNISDFSAAALSTVRTKDMGEVGDMLSDLVVELQGLNFDEQEKKGFLGLSKDQPEYRLPQGAVRQGRGKCGQDRRIS